MQTRWFETGNDHAVLMTGISVLQGLGFSPDEVAEELGVAVGTKTRDATNGGQVLMLAILGALAYNPTTLNNADANQRIKATLVVRKIDQEGKVDTDLSLEKIDEVRVKVYNALYEGLLVEFPKDTSERIARSMAEDTADKLANDLDTLLSVKDVPGKTAVRVAFQSVVFNHHGEVNWQELIVEPAVYETFFEKLSKSLFLEAVQE